MNLLPWGRLTAIGLGLVLPAFYYGIRFGSGFLRMLSRKFRRGKPYLKGSASDYLLFSLGCFAIALLGAALLLAAALQGGFQKARGPREMGKVRVEASQPGRIRLKFAMKEDYPGARSLEADLPAARWSLAGESLRWRVGPRWLGFHPGHRLEAALGSSAASGSQDRPADSRASVSGSFALSYLARRHPLWFPIAEVSERRTPWMPAQGKTYRIFAGGAGYVLLEERDDEKQGS